MSADPGIVVVGAGPTGLTVSCLLHRLGLRCRTIAQASGPTTFTRALGMFTRSLEVLDEFGAAEVAIARGQRLEVANIYADRRRVGGFRAASLTGTRHPVILALPQYATEALLEERLEQLGGTVERETTLRELRQSPGADGVTLTLDTPRGEESVDARWVVGADGAHSSVRKALGIEFAGEASSHVFVIVDAYLDRGPPTGEVHYYFSRDGIMVVSPLPDGSYRIAAALSDFIGDGSPVSLAVVQELLDRRVGGGVRLRELRDAGWGAAQVRPQTRLAQTFRSGRCVLAGDAGHIYSPIGGQGMNGGIQDAHNLAWKLALVSAGRASAALLDSYAQERRAVAQAALRITAAQMRLGGIRPRPARAVRNALVAGLSRVGMLDRYMAPESVMLRIRYAPNPGVVAGQRRGPQGRRIPDVDVGGGRRAFDVVRERPFTLLALAAEHPVDALAERIRARFGDLVAVHRVVDRPAAGGAPADGPSAGGALVDRPSAGGALVDGPSAGRTLFDGPAAGSALVDGGALRSALRVRRPSACLVRGDAHVAYFGPLDDTAPLVSYLEAMLRPAPAAAATKDGARPVDEAAA